MALIVDIKVGLDQIGYLTARRVRGGPGEVCRYDCKVRHDSLHTGKQRIAYFYVDHHYDDGAISLIEAMAGEAKATLHEVYGKDPQ